MLEVQHITPILNVSSVTESMRWFEKLGWKRSFSWNQVGMIANAADADEDGEADYGGVTSGEVEIFLCQDDEGAKKSDSPPSMAGNDGVWMTWWLPTVDAVERFYSQVMNVGVPIVMPITNQPWNAIEFRIKHPDGHVFRVSAFLDDN